MADPEETELFHQPGERMDGRAAPARAQRQPNQQQPNQGVDQQPEAQEDVMNFGAQIRRVGPNYWSNVYENVSQDSALYVHSRDHPVYASRAWPGHGYMTAEQWLEFRPKVKVLAEEMIASGHQLWAHLWPDMNAFEEGLNIVFTNVELDTFQGRFGDRAVTDHCNALEWLSNQIMYNDYHEKWSKEIIGSAMTMYIRRGQILREGDPKGTSLGKWAGIEEVEMQRDAIETLGLRLGQAMRNGLVMRNCDLHWIGMDGLDTQQVLYWRNMIGALWLTWNQARVWKEKAMGHIVEHNLDADMLIGPQDFSELQPSSRGWELHTGPARRFTNGQGTQRSLGETILSAALGKAVLQTHRYQEDDDDPEEGIHSIIAANSHDLKKVMNLTFMLGQYSKAHFTWTPVGQKYSMVVLKVPQTSQVVGALPILERGPAVTGFTFEPTTRIPRFEMDIGKKYLQVYGGHGEVELGHPAEAMWADLQALIESRVRDLSDQNRDPWDV